MKKSDKQSQTTEKMSQTSEKKSHNHKKMTKTDKLMKKCHIKGQTSEKKVTNLWEKDTKM